MELKKVSNETLYGLHNKYMSDLTYLYKTLSILSDDTFDIFLGRLSTKVAIKNIEKKLQKVRFEMAHRRINISD